ncbi:MAG: chitobiase/beta-hexosaminidase C-terminal domain-containing protein [Saprospiraceae bacterium]
MFLCLIILLLCTNCKTNKVVSDEVEHFASAALFQLMPPQVVTDSILFRENTEVVLAMDFPGSEIRYTLDGSVVTERSTLYNDAITIGETALLQAMVFHPDCKTSEVIRKQFYKTNAILNDATLALSPNADSRYAANGVSSLTDLQKGSAQFRGENRWLGFKKDTISIVVEFTKKTKMKSLVVSTLANELGWIFIPHRFELLTEGKVFAEVKRENIENVFDTGLHYVEMSFAERALNCFTLRIIGEPLPEGHNGYGGVAWFFVDEIFIPE